MLIIELTNTFRANFQVSWGNESENLGDVAVDR